MEQTNSIATGSEAAASSSNNVSIPQLTDARKQEIRKKLLERQRQARLNNSNRASASSSETAATSSASSSNYVASSSSSFSSSSSNNNINNTNTTNNNLNVNTNTINENTKSNKTDDDKPPNKEMIKKAVAFLSSPKVQSAPTSRKHSFLLSKGCTKKEIELAEKEIEEKGLLSGSSSNEQSYAQAPVPSTTNYNTTSQNPPPLPPRTYQPQSIQVVYRLSRKQKVQRGILIILFGGALLKGISIIVKREIMQPLRVLYQHYAKYLKNRNNILNKYMLQVIQYCALFINDKNNDKAKHIKTIEEIEKEKEKDITIVEKDEKESEEKDEKDEKDKNEESGEGEGEGEEGEKEKESKKPKERKAIKLKIHRKKETTKETESATEETPLLSNKNTEVESVSLKSSETGTETVRTLSAALQDYIDTTNSFEQKCKDAIDTYAYDLERNSDLFNGTLGQTMKLSSEVYQIVSREMYYNSSMSSSFYIDPYQQNSDGDHSNSSSGGGISLYTRVNNIKSEIRRLKGMLLNHRNFPKYKERRAFGSPAISASSSPITTPVSTP
eukprot:jgi/Orpsp1_1/1186703/evm.model.d7180000052648.1